MRNKFPLLLVLLVLVGGISGCKIRAANAGPDKVVRICKDTNNVISKAYGNLTIPDHLRQFEPERYQDDFNITNLISSLKNIEVNEAFIVDYVYEYRSIGAKPLLYSLLVDQTPYKTEKDYENRKPLPFTYGIETDGTDLGFLQLAMFNSLGPGFYLYWHAGYNDNIVLCNIDDVETTLDELDKMDFGLKPNLIQKAQALTISEIEPVVSIDETKNHVTVSMLMFTKWGGFFRRTYTFQQGFPHKIIDVVDKTLIEYDCGVKF